MVADFGHFSELVAQLHELGLKLVVGEAERSREIEHRQALGQTLVPEVSYKRNNYLS